ncbi:tyrosine-type recombinase/integrase [Actinomadura rubrisoli]|uniref:Integrase n=1 Tax=Actinomadura rubrisoli TaxID=2530368 RepID=A0A4R5BVQ8_9ACTN|nr:tyrosine-type recombinase/integrase [Actinomadura rubrisoli]TDD88342.1 integrase [Actinomadura rubrisoli]
MTSDELHSLLDSWLLHLRAERKSPNTLKAYGQGVRRFLLWAEGEGIEPALTRSVVNAWIASLIDGGAEGETIAGWQGAVRRFSAWLAAEGELATDQLLGLKRPTVDVKVVPELTDEQIRALLATCTHKNFHDRRDEAIIRFMVETMVRIGEVVSMDKDEVDLSTGTAVVRRGKGGKGRRVPFGPQTSRALDRYLRLRRAHRLADAPNLWLGDRGKTLGYEGAYATLTRRAARAGLPDDFTPHWLRHTGAGRWLGAGGSEGGLMAVGGWARREMIDRYTRATSEKRAADESRRLNLGDL